MPTLTVTAKGQVTLRRDLLRHLGVEPGDKIDVEKLPNGRVEVRAERPVEHISAAFGFFKRAEGPGLTVGEINEAAAAGWAGER